MNRYNPWEEIEGILSMSLSSISIHQDSLLALIVGTKVALPSESRHLSMPGIGYESHFGNVV